MKAKRKFGTLLFLVFLSQQSQVIAGSEGNRVVEQLAQSRSKLMFAFKEAEKSKREKFFEEGLQLVGQVLENQSSLTGAVYSEALALSAAHEGSLAGERKNLWSLIAIHSVEKKLLLLKSLDESFGGAAADRGLGSIYLNAPRFVSLGSPDKAALHIERANLLFPLHPGNRLLKIELFLAQSKRNEAKVLLMRLDADLQSELSKAKDSANTYFDQFAESPEWFKKIAFLKRELAMELNE